IRHRLSNFYAISLVDPISFEVWAETQAKNAGSKIKPIVLHLDNNQDISVEFRDASVSRFGFEWIFSWEGERYKWY
ncbi:uncharacterized protein BX663DRAFT_415396, partial [Cokeromyces recurvatus]|uniref:uncharacterized protein n=1 Tax=Cokeromyces recurvatus TaxID=90255 RepID=UPI00221F0F95